jgi:hypothetical protein
MAPAWLVAAALLASGLEIAASRHEIVLVPYRRAAPRARPKRSGPPRPGARVFAAQPAESLKKPRFHADVNPSAIKRRRGLMRKSEQNERAAPLRSK